MKYSLINVTEETNNKVSGYWLTDCFGLDNAIQRANDTNEVNGNKLNIAIVASVSAANPMLEHFVNLERVSAINS
jgi:hypothetical protein